MTKSNVKSLFLGVLSAASILAIIYTTAVSIENAGANDKHKFAYTTFGVQKLNYQCEFGVLKRDRIITVFDIDGAKIPCTNIYLTRLEFKQLREQYVQDNDISSKTW